MDMKRFLKPWMALEALSPGRFEAELAKRIGSPSRRAPLLKAWKEYLAGGGTVAVEAFYTSLVANPRERLEALVYSMHLPFSDFYAAALVRQLPPNAKVLEVGAFTGGLAAMLAHLRPDLKVHALEGVRAALDLGQERFPMLHWHQGWFGHDPLSLPTYDAVLLLSVLPEGYLGAIPSTLDPAAFDQQFRLKERLRFLEGVLVPGGTLVYGHGPFLGKNLAAVEHTLANLGFAEIRTQQEGGDFSLVWAQMPTELTAHPTPLLPVFPALQHSPQGVVASLAEVWALLEQRDFAEVLRQVPPQTTGRLAYLRGRALMALSRFDEAEESLARAGREEAEDLRVLCWVEQGDHARALIRLESLAARGGVYRLSLGRAYLGLGRPGEAFRQLLNAGLPEAEVPLRQSVERLQERVSRWVREGEYTEAMQRIVLVSDLAPHFMDRNWHKLALDAALHLGQWEIAERSARALIEFNEPCGATGLALAKMRIRDSSQVEALDAAALERAEPYLQEALQGCEDPTALLALGLLRLRQGRYNEALAHFERCERSSEPTTLGVAFHYASVCKTQMGFPLTQVLSDAIRAHTHRPYGPQVLLQMVQQAYQAGLVELAREFLVLARQAGWQVYPDPKVIEVFEVLEMLEQLEGPWEAFQWLSQGLSGHPDTGLLAQAFRLSRSFRASEEAETVRNKYLASLYTEGRLAEAEVMLLQEWHARPQAFEVMFDLAELYERQGHYQKAAAVWKKALELAFYLSKDLQLAREILRNLLFLNPSDPDLTLYLEELKATTKALALLEGNPDSMVGVDERQLLHEGLPQFHGEYLVVVGGHTQLRTRLLPTLEARGLEVDWFDSDSHTAGREVLRRVQMRLERAHGLLIVSSYIGHDFSEPLRLQAESLGLPVFFTPGRARGITGFLRSLSEFAPQLRKSALRAN